MGWFSNSIPERKWQDVTINLGFALKKEATSWYTVFRRISPVGQKVSTEALGGKATELCHLLQLKAVAGAIAEGGYVSDALFFLELVYIVLTSKKPAEMHQALEQTPFCLAGDAAESLSLWADAMAEQFEVKDRGAPLVAELRGYAAFIVARAMFATYTACGDTKRAKQIRATFVE